MAFLVPIVNTRSEKKGTNVCTSCHPPVPFARYHAKAIELRDTQSSRLDAGMIGVEHATNSLSPSIIALAPEHQTWSVTSSFQGADMNNQTKRMDILSSPPCLIWKSATSRLFKISTSGLHCWMQEGLVFKKQQTVCLQVE